MKTRAHVPFVDLRAQHDALDGDLQAAFNRVMEASSFILGEEVASFEQEFAAFVGAKHAIGVGCGLDALHLSLAALKIGPGDEVILPANTYIATALAVSAAGARPVLVDVTEPNFGMDPDLVARALTLRTRAIIPVHLYGQPCDIRAIQEIASRAGVAIVEDACQAHGARVEGQACGTFGDAGCFSFYPSKNLGAAGDGGMVVTNRDDVASKLRLLRDYGQERKYIHVVKGVNSRLDGLQAAILRAKLPGLDAANTARASHASRYWDDLQGLTDVRLPALLPAPEHVYHLFVVRVPLRKPLIAHLTDRGIQTGIHYPVPIHLQEAYADLNYRRGSFPVTEQLSDEVVSLPMYPELTREQRETVTEAIREFFQSRAR
jgi:dTDP-4-amino-4,6-dideoxygalactose transaminase